MILKVLTLLAVTVGANSYSVSEQSIELLNHHGELKHIGSHEPEHHEEYAWAYPAYEFSYKVIDPHTHDFKGQFEKRRGDKVEGEYWLIQPDGHKRTVKYNSDKHTGFHAKVNYEKVHDIQHQTEHEEHHQEGDEEHHQEGDEEQKEEIKEERWERKHPRIVEEHCRGDKVEGEYWLIQPDGHKRTVKYNSNKHTGFHAKVNYEKEHDIQHQMEHEEHHQEEDEEKKEEIKEERWERKHPKIVEEHGYPKKHHIGDHHKKIIEHYHQIQHPIHKEERRDEPKPINLGHKIVHHEHKPKQLKPSSIYIEEEHSEEPRHWYESENKEENSEETPEHELRPLKYSYKTHHKSEHKHQMHIPIHLDRKPVNMEELKKEQEHREEPEEIERPEHNRGPIQFGHKQVKPYQEHKPIRIEHKASHVERRPSHEEGHGGENHSQHKQKHHKRIPVLDLYKPHIRKHNYHHRPAYKEE